MKNTGISAIGDRLRFARRAQSLTQVEFAARIGVTHGMISLVETGRTDFSTRGWIQAAEVLDVPLDWLLRGVGTPPGIASECSAGQMPDEALVAIGRRFRAVRAASGLTQQRVAKILNVSQGFVSQVESGCSSFSLPRWVGIASLFEVSLDWLICGTGPGLGESGRRPPNELDTPGDAPGVGAPVGIVGSLPRQVEDRQAG